MRLSSGQIEAIRQETAHFFGADARAWLFRFADDTARGGTNGLARHVKQICGAYTTI